MYKLSTSHIFKENFGISVRFPEQTAYFPEHPDYYF